MLTDTFRYQLRDPEVQAANAALALGDCLKPPEGSIVEVGLGVYGVVWLRSQPAVEVGRVMGQMVGGQVGGRSQFQVEIGPRTKYRFLVLPRGCPSFDQWEGWD